MQINYEMWDINARGSGTVEYRRFKRPNDSTFLWGDAVGSVVKRQRGGFFLADERHASSAVKADLPVGTVMESIKVEYRRGVKRGSKRRYFRLTEDGWEPTNEVPNG